MLNLGISWKIIFMVHQCLDTASDLLQLNKKYKPDTRSSYIVTFILLARRGINIGTKKMRAGLTQMNINR